MIDFEKIGFNRCCPVCGQRIKILKLSEETEGYQEIEGSCNFCGIYVKAHEYKYGGNNIRDVDIRDKWNKIFRPEFKTITQEDIENAIVKHFDTFGEVFDTFYVHNDEILSSEAQKYCEEKNIKVVKEK